MTFNKVLMMALQNSPSVDAGTKNIFKFEL